MAHEEGRTTGLAASANRRTLLKGLSFAGLAAGSATVAAVPAQTKPANVDPRGLSYQETGHIRKYYDLARD